MKKLLFFALIALIVTLYSGCKKDDDSNNESSTPAFSVKIDGTLWNAPVFTAIHETTSNSTVIIATSTDVMRQLQVSFKGQTTGTFTFAEDDLLTYGTYANTAMSEIYTTLGMTSTTDEIVVTKYDKSNHLISGTFHFTAKDVFETSSMSFTEGVFTNITYTE